jgi:hypothetical protein
MKGVKTMEEITQEMVNRARKDADEAYVTYANLKEQFAVAESDYLKKCRRFRDFDYKLALTDGRLKKLPTAGERKPKKQPELTLEQLKSIAAKLGVNITVDEPEENEEVVEAIAEETSNGL